MVDSQTYLERARLQLDNQSHEGIFYAAFELRCGIEARMQEYMEGHGHIAKRKKEEWKLGNLDKTILKYFGDPNRITQVIISQRIKPHEKFIAYYTPVTPELIKLGQRLGDLLHRQKKFILPEDAFWTKSRGVLEKAYNLLEISNRGTLMGPPIWNKKTKTANIIAVVSCSKELEIYKNIIQEGKLIDVNIKHLKNFPEN